MKNEEIKELSNDLQEVGKYATDWLVAETKEMLAKNGRFKSSEHTKSLNEIVAEQLIERGYQKKSRTVVEILQAVDLESSGQTVAITNVLRQKYGAK
ncbi:MAG: hypothetical protein IJX81_01110 [Clostridia bacterium]|nr:hypothetical protein [Clostridia bacterium]